MWDTWTHREFNCAVCQNEQMFLGWEQVLLELADVVQRGLALTVDHCSHLGESWHGLPLMLKEGT